MMIDVSGERCGNLKFAFYFGFGIDWEAPRYDGIIGISWTSTSLKSLFRHQLDVLLVNHVKRWASQPNLRWVNKFYIL